MWIEVDNKIMGGKEFDTDYYYVTKYQVHAK